MLWNANLDRAPAKRQSKAELLKELRKWEDERAALRSKQKREKEKEKPDDHAHLVCHFHFLAFLSLLGMQGRK
jgi:hypothetical protein